MAVHGARKRVDVKKKPGLGSTISRGVPFMDRLATRLIRVVASNWAIGIALTAFVLINLLLAAELYQNIIDEPYHVAIVEAYSQQWGWRLHNSGVAEGLGDVEYFVSFFYHYALSFPARVLTWLGVDGQPWLFALRSFSVLFIALGLLVWRKVAIMLGASKALANSIVLVLMAIPMFSILAAMVNYDSLLFLTASLVAISGVHVVKSSGMNLKWWLYFLAFGAISLMVKYTFAPVFLVATVVLILQKFRGFRFSLVQMFRSGYWGRRWREGLPALLLAVGATVPAAYRYLRNLVQWGQVSPACDVVANYEYCIAYGPFGRNERLDAGFPDLPATIGGAVDYFNQWYGSLIGTLNVTGVLTPDGQFVAGPSDLQRSIAVALAGAVLLIVLLLGRNVAQKYWMLLVSMFIAHLAAQYVLNFSEFRAFGVMVGASGRYFLPYIPILVTLAALGFRVLIDRFKARRAIWKVAILGVVLLLATQGGGPLTLLARGSGEFFVGQPGLIEPLEFLMKVSKKLYIHGYGI